jgi:hypothetical protein
MSLWQTGHTVSDRGLRLLASHNLPSSCRFEGLTFGMLEFGLLEKRAITNESVEKAPEQVSL